jgi:hypothetical protein
MMLLSLSPGLFIRRARFLWQSGLFRHQFLPSGHIFYRAIIFMLPLFLFVSGCGSGDAPDRERDTDRPEARQTVASELLAGDVPLLIYNARIVDGSGS